MCKREQRKEAKKCGNTEREKGRGRGRGKLRDREKERESRARKRLRECGTVCCKIICSCVSVLHKLQKIVLVKAIIKNDADTFSNTVSEQNTYRVH